MNDDVTNPNHYKRLEPEPIAVIESWGLGFALGNAVKYIARAGAKPGESAASDLAKAAWYLGRALLRVGGRPPGDLAIQLQTDLAEEAELARADARRWKITAHALAMRARANRREDAPPDALVDGTLAGKPMAE